MEELIDILTAELAEKLAETDITRSMYAMLPLELKDVVKDHAQRQFNLKC